MPEVFVCGDLAHVEQDGQQVPGVAQPAMQMGDHVARMIGAGPERQAADKLPLLRQGRHGDDRSDGRGGQGGVAVQGALERVSGVG